MVTLQELSLYLNELLQVAFINDYCTNGIQVEGKPRIAKLATAVSASLETIQAAVDLGVDALIVHHGLFWNKDNHDIVGTVRKKLALLLENDISLLAYHLPLDSHKEIGNNWKAAKEMGWKDLEPFSIGVKGKLDPMSREQLKQKLESYYGHAAHVALGGKEEVRSAALISGGSYKSIPEAARAGVDCFITGNFDEPAWHQAHEEGINFYALGHSATERIGPKALGEHIQERFGVPVQFIDLENPF